MVSPSPAGPEPAPVALLDAAQGPLHPAARATLLAAVDQAWADPRRRHPAGRAASDLLEGAREALAGALGLASSTLSLHSSSAEALVTGLAGLRHARRRHGASVVTSTVERSVLLLETEGFATRVAVDRLGRVDADAFVDAATGEGVTLAALQDANGEIGTRQPVGEVHRRCAERGVPLLVDASSSAGRDPLPPGEVVVADASTLGGPPLGLLIVRTGTRFLLPGPRREFEHRRAWAPPWVPLALAAAEAARQTAAVREQEQALARGLVERIRTVVGGLRDVEVVGEPVDRLPHVVSFSVLFADGESLVDALARRGVAVASGSACTSSALEPSHVLTAIGALTHGDLRVTLPLSAVSPTVAEDVEHFLAVLPGAIDEVRARLGTAGL